MVLLKKDIRFRAKRTFIIKKMISSELILALQKVQNNNEQLKKQTK